MFNVVLYEPEIPPNTGNIMRLCANTGCRLHLVKPLGFELEDKQLRRAGLDYRDFADVRVHESLGSCLETLADSRQFAITTKAETYYSDVKFAENDVLIFGPETRGLPAPVLSGYAPEQQLRIPMQPDSRSLNLANAVSVIVYEAWRQLDFS